MNNQANDRKLPASRTLVNGLACALLLSSGLAQGGDRRAQRVEVNEIWLEGESISCPGYFLDGVTVAGTLEATGIAHNAGFLTPWNDNAGGQHLQQISPRMTLYIASEDGAYEWYGHGRGRFTMQGGGGNGDHYGGVMSVFQFEYYYAQGDYPDLQWSYDFLLVADAKGNLRVLNEEGSWAERLLCVMD